MAPSTIVFDVNETLLDMSALDPLFADAFGDKAVRRVWFSQTLQNAMAATILGAYAPFNEMASAALEMTARKRGVTIDDERKRRILRGMSALPAHGDVAPGLERLRDAGYRLAVLTNSTHAVVTEQLDHARLAHYFETLLSVDVVRRFKPAREVYLMAAQQLAVEPDALLLVAAHEWDVAGALHAGVDAAFIARHGTSLNPLNPRPALVVPDVRVLAATLAEMRAA